MYPSGRVNPLPDHASLCAFPKYPFCSLCQADTGRNVQYHCYELGEVSGETVFIDGTKIEASANKYTFVWKKAVTKNQGKLLDKTC